MGELIRVEGLSKNYGDFRLADVAFALPGGSIMGLIGENGAGKTTALKLLLNLIHRDGGNIELFGLDLLAHEREIKQRIGVVLDEGFFHELLRPKDVAAVLSRMYDQWDGRLFRRYLDRFSLPEGKAIKELSRGMRMKLSLAAALSHRPQLLILDEATSGLDPVVRNEILDVFLDFIQDEEHGILISSHITSDLERAADHIAFLHRGRLLFCQPKDEVLERYGVLKCGQAIFERVPPAERAGYRKSAFGYEVLVRNRAAVRRRFPEAVVDPATLEEIMLYTVKGDA